MELAPDTSRFAVCGALPIVAEAKLAALPSSSEKLPLVTASEPVLVQLDPAPVIVTTGPVLLPVVKPIRFAPVDRRVAPSLMVTLAIDTAALAATSTAPARSTRDVLPETFRLAVEEPVGLVLRRIRPPAWFE